MRPNTERTTVAGPAGRIECAIDSPTTAPHGVAVLFHPHPLHGGTMNNRITYAMYQAFQRLGCSVMRFNFRGVGRSQGRTCLARDLQGLRKLRRQHNRQGDEVGTILQG